MAQVNTMKLRASNKQAGRKIGGTIAIFAFLTLLGLFMLFPIYLMFEVLNSNRVPFSRYVFNSVAVTVSVTVLQCIFASMAAFVLAKCKFPGSKLINSIIVVALLYQSNVIYIMQYIVMAKLGLIDNPLALILPSIASPMGLFLMRQSISQVPDAMIEAAKVDGAGLFRICWQIVMPNQKPALMTIIIFAFQAAWRIEAGSVVFQEQYKTLPTVVNQAASAGLARAGVAAAAAVFMLIPPIVVFMLAQRQVIETMAHSGIKD